MPKDYSQSLLLFSPPKRIATTRDFTCSRAGRQAVQLQPGKIAVLIVIVSEKEACRLQEDATFFQRVVCTVQTLQWR